jgi:hypothetical protein
VFFIESAIDEKIFYFLCSSGGFIFLKFAYIRISYTIFSKPPNKKGAAKNDADCNIYPAIDGDMACATFLEMFVNPAAVVLSSSLTTATIYDCLVGTSICDNPILARYSIIASKKEGEKATSIISIFEGKWVNTIVFINPILSAIFVDIMNEKAVRTPAIEKT